MIHMPSMRDRNRRSSLGQVSGAVAIHDAVVKGKIHLAKFILDAVESHTVVNSRDAHGKTPLIRAIRIEEDGVRPRVVDLLVRYKADVNLVDNVGRTALSYACELHRNEIIRKLVKNNVDPNMQDNNGNSPLMYCAMTGNATGIEILSKSFRRLGLDVDNVNAEGMTPLMVAARNAYTECAKLLAHEAKASVSRRDEVRNMNAIDWAREGGCSTPEVEALQARPRTHSKSSVTDTCVPQERMLPKRELTNPNRNVITNCSTASLPDIDAICGSRTSAISTTLNNSESQLDVRRGSQNLSEFSSKFSEFDLDEKYDDGKPNKDILPCDKNDLTRGSRTTCGTRPISYEDEKALYNVNKPRLSLDDILNPRESSSLPVSTVGIKNKRFQSPITNQRRRPFSANISNRHANSQSKSFDSVLTSNNRASKSIENLTLTVSHPTDERTVVFPHPPKTGHTKACNLSRLSHLSRSTEVLSHLRPSSEGSCTDNVGSSHNVSYVNLRDMDGNRKGDRNDSLSPGDLPSVYHRGDPHNHLPSLSPSRFVSKEV